MQVTSEIVDELRPHVLVVDPDADTRDLHTLTLKPLTPDVESVADGAEALAAAIARRPALVVTETRLPRIDGFTLCALLRAEPVTRDTEILVVTGAAEAEDADRAIAAGADAVLVKPVQPEQVRAHARRLLDAARELRNRSEQARARVAENLARSEQVLRRSAEIARRRIMSRTYLRETTTAPPEVPPQLSCPSCFGALVYDRSHLGGVSPRHPEQWDYFVCVSCGTFQYRHRTRKLKKV